MNYSISIKSSYNIEGELWTLVDYINIFSSYHINATDTITYNHLCSEYSTLSGSNFYAYSFVANVQN